MTKPDEKLQARGGDMDAPERIWAEPDGDNIIIHNGSDDLEGLIATGYLTEYIRADLAAPVRVKPLVWHNFDAWTHWAEGACGTYHVEERNGYWQVELRVGGLVHGVTATDDTTPADLDAAKAAAQADYAARIFAALEPAPDLAELDAAKIIQKRIDAIIQGEGSWEPDTNVTNLPEWAETAVEELEGILAALAKIKEPQT